MSIVQFRALLAAVVLGIGAALGAAVPAAAGTAPGNEGLAGRPAPMPNGHVAAPPAVTSSGTFSANRRLAGAEVNKRPQYSGEGN